MYFVSRPDALPFPKDSDLKWSHYDLLRLLGMMPYAGARELAGVMSRGHELMYRRLWQLSDRGYVAKVELGATRPQVARWFILPEGRDVLEPPDHIWHLDWSLSRVLEMLPQLETFYRAVAEQSPKLGKLVRFRWFRGAAWGAAALYEHGWVAFFWSGILQSEGRLRRMFNQLVTELENYNVRAGRCYPSVLCFVVSDAWQRELVTRVARDLSMDDRLQVWCVADGQVSGCREALEGHGWVGQVLDVKGLGRYSLGQRLANSPWSRPGGKILGRVLESVLEWPGLGSRFCSLATGDDAKRIRTELGALADREYLRRYVSSGIYRYVMGRRGLDLLSRRDGVNAFRQRRTTRGVAVPDERNLGRHEYGLMSMVEGFLAGGLTVAAGWRASDHLGVGGIAPDAMVWLSSSPYGPGWHDVKYEPRGRVSSAVVQRILGCGSAGRPDRWPVLAVVRDERVEAVFHEVGREAKLRLLTSTVARLDEFPVLQHPRCWSMYGRFVSLE